MFEFFAKVLFVFWVVKLEGLIEVSDESEGKRRFFAAVLLDFRFFVRRFWFVGIVGYFFDEVDVGLRKRSLARVIQEVFKCFIRQNKRK